MSKVFTCCELIKRIKSSRAYAEWPEKEKYLAVEFLHRIMSKSFNEKEEQVDDGFICKECNEWFNHNARLQMPIIGAELEKESLEERLEKIKTNKGTVMERVVKNLKEQTDKQNQTPPPSFGKSPQE